MELFISCFVLFPTHSCHLMNRCILKRHEVKFGRKLMRTLFFSSSPHFFLFFFFLWFTVQVRGCHRRNTSCFNELSCHILKYNKRNELSDGIVR